MNKDQTASRTNRGRDKFKIPDFLDLWLTTQLKAGGPFNVVLMMSGKGTLARPILEKRKRLAGISIIAVVTNNVNSNARALSKEFNLPMILLGKNGRQVDYSPLYDLVARHGPTFALFCGYMRIVETEFLRKILAVNMHPSDLTIRNATGHAIYVGMEALARMIDSHHPYVRSSLYSVSEEIDQGHVIATTEALPKKSIIGLGSREVHQRLQALEVNLYLEFLEFLCNYECHDQNR